MEIRYHFYLLSSMKDQVASWQYLLPDARYHLEVSYFFIIAFTVSSHLVSETGGWNSPGFRHPGAESCYLRLPGTGGRGRGKTMLTSSMRGNFGSIVSSLGLELYPFCISIRALYLGATSPPNIIRHVVCALWQSENIITWQMCRPCTTPHMKKYSRRCRFSQPQRLSSAPTAMW